MDEDERKGRKIVAQFYKLDLSSHKDVKKLEKLLENAPNDCTEVGLLHRIQTRDADLWMQIHGLTEVAELTSYLEKIAQSPSDRILRKMTYGHSFCKLSQESIGYWLGATEGLKTILSKSKDDNSNLFLGVMYASAELASQAFNRYDTGLFYANAFKEKDASSDRYGVPKCYPELSKMAGKCDKFFGLWNRVMLKYLSNVAHVKGFVASGETEKFSKKSLVEMCEYVQPSGVPYELTDIGCELYGKGDYSLVLKEFSDHPEKYASRIEEKARKTYQKIAEFTEVLQEYDRRMDFAKPM